MNDTKGMRRASMSIKDRRQAMLLRTGLSERQKTKLETPSLSFYWILFTVIMLVLLGLIMVLSSSAITNLHNEESAWRLFWKQLMWSVLGAGGMYFAYKTPYQTLRNAKLLLPLVLGFIVVNVLVAVKGVVINGARAWFEIGSVRIQPSEFMKIVVVLWGANLLATRHRAVSIPRVVLLPMLAGMGLSAGLCVLQNDYGSAVIFGGTVLAMMFLAGLPFRQLIPTTLGILFLGGIVLSFAENAKLRMLAFLDLEGTKSDSGYQVYQSILSIANGGLSGTGIGSGTSKWGYVPLAYSDFIFAVIAEELGFLGAFIVAGGFILLVVFGISVALSAPDKHGAFLAGGITSWFGIQACVNIGGVIGALPMTGLTLPFLSYGGSSLLTSMTASGILLNVARQAKS